MLSLSLVTAVLITHSAKYPLAIVAMVLKLFESGSCGAYDIGCSFLQTVLGSSLAPEFKRMCGTLCVNAFHGYSHNFACQSIHHPNVIAGAGIVVRNSIILVDFIELRLAEGHALEDAVIDAGAVRFRPMALTAAAVIVGASVILFDPIFQGLAVSLMAGEAAALLLSRVTVPVLYYLSRRTS